QLLECMVRAERLEWQEIRSFERDPRGVNDSISWGLLTLIQRNFAPLAERASAVLGRLEQVPRALEESRRCLGTPARIFTELALSEMAGTRDFIAETVPATFASLENEVLRSRIGEVCQTAVEAYQAHLKWLEEDLLPRSTASYALGAKLYRKKLLYAESVDTPLESLLEQAWKELRRLQERFRAVAADIEPGADPQELLTRISRDHPAAEGLLEAGRSTLRELREFCVSADLLTLTDAPDPFVIETPGFARDLAFAMMDTPGPFEEVAREAFYYITVPAESWDAARTEEFLTLFSRPGLRVIGAHEVYPGHYAQLLRIRETPSLIRRIADSGAFVEGWAHYCEEMLMEVGYGADDPSVRLCQLHEALLRACRFIAGISLHCLGMTVEEATAFFQREGYQAAPSAEMEAKRGTTDPHYLIYTLGKLQILELREECKAAWGGGFTLRRFHDALLSHGIMPIALQRRAILG
ncbi:MAG TPA: DUF885 domain-containing protein, partial [Armatimonadota bacterium]